MLARFSNIGQALPWHLSYMTNYLVAMYGDFDENAPRLAHFWSLAVEEQFYLLWPAVVLLTPVRRLKAVLAPNGFWGPYCKE